MNDQPKTFAVLSGLVALFLALAAAFYMNLWGKPAPLATIPLVEPWVTNTATVRTNYADLKRFEKELSELTAIHTNAADLKRVKEDLQRVKDALSDFDCYGCHDRKKPPPLRFDTNLDLIIPKEHDDIVMKHGSHNRNNNCFNCHNETNLVVLQARDGRALKMEESPSLCGSCHGPTYRDWEAGVHGRTSGKWTHEPGTFDRKPCVSCHNPHKPAFPGRQPAPGPHPLRAQPQPALAKEGSH